MDETSLNTISEKREFIHNLVTSKFFEDLDIDAEKVKILFHAYDLVFFKGQILNRVRFLANEPSKNNVSVDSKLEFNASRRNSGYGSVSGFYYDKILVENKYIYVKKFFLDISPDILKNAEQGIPKAAGEGCDSKLRCLMLIMEHEIIHLLFSLWGYDTIEYQNKDFDLYGPHGRLFECMLNTYFGHTEYSHNLSLQGIESMNYMKGIPKERIQHGFSYWEYSCYMDSVLTLLLENQCSFWRKNIFDFNPIDSVNPELANLMKQELQQDYFRLKKGEQRVQCINFRKLLSKHDPAMRKGKSWQMHEVAAFYANLVELFPALKIDIPTVMVRPKLKSVESIQYKSEYLFSVEEFINSNRSREDYKEILWNECKSPILVFSYQGTRRIKNFDKLDKDKERALAPKILNKYKLVGVVVLKGLVTQKGAAGHYVSYFVAKDGNWYSYDDTDPKVRLVGEGYVDNLPRSGIWEESNNKMPALYFYALDEYGIDRRKTKNISFEKLNRKDGGTIFKIKYNKYKNQIMDYSEELGGTTTISGEIIYVRFNDIEKGNKLETFLLNL